MRRIMLTVAYDGTDFHGWQAQPGVRTVEGELNRVLSEWLNDDISVIGASRTDTGVHALGNLAVFDMEISIPTDKIAYALNTKLPSDVKVQKAEEVAPDFHPRHCESRKTYEYRFYAAKYPMPLARRFTSYTYLEPDVERMRQGARYLIGEHDFKSFCCVRTQAESTVRTIYDISVVKEGPEIIIRIQGNGFLYNMVRIIAGTLLDVGTGRWEPAYVKEMLEAEERSAAGPTAPPEGLCLCSVEIMDRNVFEKNC